MYSQLYGMVWYVIRDMILRRGKEEVGSRREKGQGEVMVRREGEVRNAKKE